MASQLPLTVGIARGAGWRRICCYDASVDGGESLRPATDDRMRVLRIALERRERELEILSVVAERLHGEENASEILRIVLDEILDRLGLKAAWVFLGNESDRVLRLAAHRGVSDTYLEQIRTDGLGECLCAEVCWSGQTRQARNTGQCPRMPHIVAGLASPVAHACIPLWFEGTARGVLNVAARAGELFSEDELRFLDTLGRQVCLALERADHLRAERLRNQEARALASISKAIGGSLDVDAVLRAVGETARELLGVDRAHVFLGADPRRLRVAHLSGEPHAELVEGQALDLVALSAQIQRGAFETRRLLTVDDWSSDPRVNKKLARKWGMGSGIVAPLLARQQVLGLLVLTRVAAHRWSEDQVDVAEALASQAAVALENARLFEETRRAYRELKEAQARIIQTEKMAVLGTFASGLAHEVRNPLNSITLQLSILERRTAPLEEVLAGQIHGLIGVIREEIKRLDSLVSDFLLFSRISRIQHQPADLGSLTDEVVRLLRPEARAAGVTLRRQRIGEPLPLLRVDSERIKQVVINLVRNAIEALPDGGVVTVEEGLLAGKACLVVRDTGPGLPAGVDVFQLFVTTKPKGTGLGLSIAQQIVLEHGGEITAESDAGRGATFTVLLPLTPAAEALQESPSP